MEDSSSIEYEIVSNSVADSSIPQAPINLNSAPLETVATIARSIEVPNVGSVHQDLELPQRSSDPTQAELLSWQLETSVDREIRVSIARATLMKNLQGNMNQANFSFFKLPKVKFMGEAAVDNGGPRRELFRLMMTHIVNSSGMFHKVGQSHTFSHNVSYLEDGNYHHTGKLVGWSVLHSGPGLHILSQEAMAMLRGETPNLLHWMEYVMDDKTRALTEKIWHSTADNFKEILDGALPELEDNGFPLAANWTFENKESHLNSILLQHFYYRNLKAFNDFKSGLNVIGNLWKRMEAFPKIQELLLGFSASTLTADAFEELLEYQYSEPGSNSFSSEQQTAFSMSMFLQKLEAAGEGTANGREELMNKGFTSTELDELVEGGHIFDGSINMSIFLCVLTGSSRIPPVGFEKKISITFFDQMIDGQKYPHIATCGLTMELPRGYGDEEVFAKYMDVVIRGSAQYFGHV